MTIQEKLKEKRLEDAKKADRENSSAFSNPFIAYALFFVIMMALALVLPPLFWAKFTGLIIPQPVL